MTTIGSFSIETLTHFNCPHCTKWWSIGDPDVEKTAWFCPWCGEKVHFQLGENPSFPIKVKKY